MTKANIVMFDKLEDWTRQGQWPRRWIWFRGFGSVTLQEYCQAIWVSVGRGDGRTFSAAARRALESVEEA